MAERLAGKVAIVVGAGQTPGDTIGNGRATAILFAREGARVVCVDRNGESAAETVAQIEREGGSAVSFAADATDEGACRAFVDETTSRFGALDILHNNVGIGVGDDTPSRIDAENWDRILHVNLRSVVLPCKAALPVLRAQRSGSIINVSSIAAVCSTPAVAYKASKAALNAYTQSLAIGNAKYGIRANVIMPGLMNTPMAIEGISAALGIGKEELIARRNAMVPLGAEMGDAWDVAYAALYLASDEARFVTGVALPVDGGQSARIG
jgi:NAD(P)-dependent dehydrogenase (short-subunit alcohol dehydrogenase family)